MAELSNCPNCDAKLKGGMFGANNLLEEKYCKIISKYGGTSEKYCDKCGKGLMENAFAQVKRKIKDAQVVIKENIMAIPIVTIQSPVNWDYQVVGLATGQSTTGTGLFSEISSSFTDLLGLQANTYNQKIADGESLCAEQLRRKVLNVKGHAVIATDIDYAELGSIKGMIMVCMSGTIVELNNPEILGETNLRKITEIHNKMDLIKESDADLQILKTVSLSNKNDIF